MNSAQKPTVPEVLPFVGRYYGMEDNGGGGSLHIVLDDGNVEDGHVSFCLEWAQQNNDSDGELLARVLLRMSRTQRCKLYRLCFPRTGCEPPFTAEEREQLGDILLRELG